MAKTKAKAELVVKDLKKENVGKMLQVVNDQIKALGAKYMNDDAVLQDDKLPGLGSISDQSDVSELIKALAMVKVKEEAYVKAFESVQDPMITIEKFPFKLKGATVDKWVACINMQIGKVTYQEKMDKLKKAAAFLERHQSEEDRFKNDMTQFKELFS